MHAPSEQILSYFDGSGTDDRGRLLVDVQHWTDEQLEGCHDQIQWMFPVPEPSKFNLKAPLLTPAIIAAFTPEMKNVLRISFWRMMKFYGFNVTENPIEISTPEDFDASWLQPWDHNLLRLTRILRCLNLLGLKEEKQALFECLTLIYSREIGQPEPRISGETFRWWVKAAYRENW